MCCLNVTVPIMHAWIVIQVNRYTQSVHLCNHHAVHTADTRPNTQDYIGLIVWQLYATHTVYMWQFHLSYLLQLGYKTITDNHALLLGQGHNCHHTIIAHDLYQDALLHSAVPRPIPSISVCNIEKLGMGLRTRLYTLTCISAQAAIMKCMLHNYTVVPACHQA